MNECCIRCNNTGTVKTTICLNNNYSIDISKCTCKNSVKYVAPMDPFENLRKKKAEHDAIDRMTTKEVLQYIRDKITGRDWTGGMKEIKTSETCPF